SAVAPDSAGARKQRKVLYYRNPMGLPDTSPIPKKDPMGMDYTPVYEGEEEPAGTPGQIRLSTEKTQKLGVRTEAAQIRAMDSVVRAAGRIEPNERRVFAVAPKFEGWIERLFVNATGEPVRKGQPLFEVYSPELVSVQQEYALATQGMASLKDAYPEARTSMQRLAESSLMRLKNWDISEEQIRALTQSGDAKRTLIFRAPESGIVMEKKALQGMRFMPGEMLYQIADLSSVWVLADVFEQDIGQVRVGAKAKVAITAYPDAVFEGRITYIYPTLKAETRTVPVRLEIANPTGRLKPSMFAQVDVTATTAKGLTVPKSAIIDSGTRRIVLVQTAEGRFVPRDVKLGIRGENYVHVLEGLKENEQVVVAANFLIDAESNLKAVLDGLGNALKTDPAAAPPVVAPARAAAHHHEAEGKLESIDSRAGSVSITHGPVPSLKWPGMTMEFELAHAGLLEGLKPGAAIAFDFVERRPGEWVITRIERKRPPAPSGKAAAAAPADHSAH
ncbi:MAG: efflux RND transporter periplasmic adaptor subunit, partial [Betaproteobacteria bacterium]|nr:efflux RND transporter periplasmic adaptor subunit [Betaproteobacteria bacterium]